MAVAAAAAKLWWRIASYIMWPQQSLSAVAGEPSLDATPSINFHLPLSDNGSIPFSRRNTIAAIMAVRLFPSKNGWLLQRRTYSLPAREEFRSWR